MRKLPRSFARCFHASRNTALVAASQAGAWRCAAPQRAGQLAPSDAAPGDTATRSGRDDSRVPGLARRVLQRWFGCCCRSAVDGWRRNAAVACGALRVPGFQPGAGAIHAIVSCDGLLRGGCGEAFEA
jgi:hypothetical protein